MLKGAVARRYAEAIFEISVEQQTLDRWRDDVGLIAEYFRNRQLAFILGEPNVRFERKEAIIRDLLSAKVQPDSLRFALLLAERGLVGIAPRVRDEFERLYNEYRGQAVAQVTTAMPLDDEMRARVSADLQAMTGKRILLQERVDPTILGGAIARVGDTLIDGSVRRRLMILRDQIRQGSFGGPSDGTDGFVMPIIPDIGPSAGGTPFVVTPTRGNGASPSNESGPTNPQGPTSATEMAPRTGDSPHLAPRSASSAGNQQTGRSGNQGGSQRQNGQSNANRRGKGRKR